jgi:hypothetical protein
VPHLGDGIPRVVAPATVRTVRCRFRIASIRGAIIGEVGLKTGAVYTPYGRKAPIVDFVGNDEGFLRVERGAANCLYNNVD